MARHAESVFNVRGVLNGDPAVPGGLTDNGREQARWLGERLKNERIDLCVTTEFERTRETADIALAGVSWLLREDRLPTLKPPVEVLPQVTLTNPQVRWIFVLTVILLPGAVALAGIGVWLWRRR